MKLTYFAYIFLGPELNPDLHRADISAPNYKLTTVGIAFTRKEEVIHQARKLLAQGVQMIELCGGFGPLWIAKVSEAIDYQVPVGSVAYGPEARQPLLDLLRD